MAVEGVLAVGRPKGPQQQYPLKTWAVGAVESGQLCRSPTVAEPVTDPKEGLHGLR